jgi:hypothetical protein
VSPQAIVWFGISVVALISALRLLVRRYVLKTPQAMQSRGSYTLFAVFMLICALGALLAGLVAL